MPPKQPNAQHHDGHGRDFRDHRDFHDHDNRDQNRNRHRNDRNDLNDRDQIDRDNNNSSAPRVSSPLATKTFHPTMLPHLLPNPNRNPRSATTQLLARSPIATALPSLQHTSNPPQTVAISNQDTTIRTNTHT